MNEKEQTEGSIELCAVCGTARNDGGWHDLDFCIAILEARISTLRNVKLKFHQEGKRILHQPLVPSHELRFQEMLLQTERGGPKSHQYDPASVTINKESFLKP